MIEAAVEKAISHQFGVNEDFVNLDKTLAEFDADSLDLVELVMGIEDELGIEISDDSIDALGGDALKVTDRQLVDVAAKLKG
ncbi:acyl carrier protein [Paraburkholderia sp. SARCC-3016]|uniref:acyl carrier protein n=1 Tax=Paraburkholderia sp. SARCC-3016 TaxID=3058611 RepID=UPI002807722A|nr:acyl carrier protein [Paraburkholderia sp. SARCC-3016]MDQ7981889.1 acyl carrier protein [Paraburkholderia sp. SARCC-3016]